MGVVHALALAVVLWGAVPLDAPVRPDPGPAAEMAPASAPSAASLAERGPSAGRRALGVTAAALTIAATSVVAVLAGGAIPAACGGALGRPEPLCSASGLVLGGGVQVGLVALLVPEVYRLANDASGAGDVGASRAGLWRYARWAAVAAAFFAFTYFMGAVAEHGAYGNGQPAMLVGGVGLAVAGMAFDVLAVIGVSRGHAESWKRR